MEFIADFHIHSKYSRATSEAMNVEELVRWAKLKGITLMGTGDFTHPVWLMELKDKLKPSTDGLYEYNGVHFILTCEVYNNFYVEGKAKRIHNIIFAPSFDVVEKLNNKLQRYGDLVSDGRPILHLNARDLVKICLDISPDCFIVPSHAWTPHFSIFGSNSGFDTVEECFGEETKNIHCLETGLSCYDEKTEVLTMDGWKKFSNIQYSDKICTLNLSTNEIEFQAPDRIFTYRYNGKMYKLKTKRVNLLVTPNHKLLYSPCDFRNRKPYSLKEAELLFNKSKIFKKDGIWIGENPEYFILPSVEIKHGNRHHFGFRVKKEKQLSIKSWLKFFGFWLAEGWVNEGKNGDYNVCVCNQNAKLLNEMKEILEGFGYRVFLRGNVIRVRDFQLFHYLRQFGKSSDKFISSDIKSLSKKLSKILFDYYIKGDGHIYGRSKKGLSATTTSIRLRDDLQEVALKIGISAYYKLDRKKGALFVSARSKKKYKQNKDSWAIYFIRRNRPIVLPSTIKKYNYIESWVNYDGFVYCATVSNHVMYIRREGIPLWCGNSDPPMNWRLSKLDRYALISNSDSHSPHRIGREANAFDCDLNYREIIDAIKSKDKRRFLYTIEFFPEEGKYHYDGHRNCKARVAPKEALKNRNLCPVCGRKLTVGVMHRVEDLADRPEGFIPDDAIPFKHMIPLDQIIADARGVREMTQTVEREYMELVNKCGSEFNILLRMSEDELKGKLPQRITEGIIRVREGKVNILPGYDGEYGTVKIFSAEETGEKQLTLF